MTTMERNSRRQLQGVVTSARSQSTITIAVEQMYKHAKYGKYIRRRRKYLVHDPESIARVGDTVEVASTRPISKRKRWRLVRVVERSKFGEDVAPVAAVSTADTVDTGATGAPGAGGDA